MLILVVFGDGNSAGDKLLGDEEKKLADPFIFKDNEKIINDKCDKCIS